MVGKVNFLLLLIASVRAPAASRFGLKCSDEARQFREFHQNQTFSAICPRGCQNTGHTVKGSRWYTDDSSICRSAIHAGATNNNGGRIELRRGPGLQFYSSTTHNGITSHAWGDWTHSFSFSFDSESCVRSLGIAKGIIPNANFKSSTTFRTFTNSNWYAHLARLNSNSLINAWRPEHDDREQWWQVDLGDIYDVRAIVTQGSQRYTRPQYITAYEIKHKLTEEMDWLYALDENGRQKVFSGNTNNDGRVTNHFVPSLTARYIRLLPWTWHRHISLRAELLVCRLLRQPPKK